ncbi:hypothetical protein NUH30_19205 [Leptospira sp. 85282-16]|uniref:Polyketide cyclase n=1 Tax=Leptospira montravelensis TaxID=2484961 RepID=A0ABY2LRA9_9LEPT|nr:MULTISPECIES: hypothetical protein [Leptospira]MCT8335823.1 hypothetical protein [Leptospira sp. 85282-16]TGK77541.1 hypothetical protein EHQ19_19060 [Leptospira montravelensis]TGL02608.1 hypothetical protein EHQ31_09280 [Leptospira montravelensis]
MKQRIFGVIILLLILNNGINPNDLKQIEKFDEEEYKLVFTDSNDTNSIKEFLRNKDKLEKWDRMITRFNWKNVSTIKEILPIYLEKVITPNSIRKPNILKNSNTTHKEDFIFEFFLSTGNGDYIEYNLHRMITTNDDKVESFIFAIKLPLTGTKEVDQENIRNILEPNRPKWIAEIQKININ